ncbi:hypothetical protein KUCAC02_024728, partial [Chaenocephalus aceratus]
ALLPTSSACSLSPSSVCPSATCSLTPEQFDSNQRETCGQILTEDTRSRGKQEKHRVHITARTSQPTVETSLS